MVPANRLGHSDAQMSAATLRAIAEVAIIVAFVLFQTLVLRENLKVNHIVGFCLVVVGVVIVVAGPWENVVFAPTPSAADAQVGSGGTGTNSVHSNAFLGSAGADGNARYASAAGEVQLTTTTAFSVMHAL